MPYSLYLFGMIFVIFSLLLVYTWQYYDSQMDEVNSIYQEQQIQSIFNIVGGVIGVSLFLFIIVLVNQAPLEIMVGPVSLILFMGSSLLGYVLWDREHRVVDPDDEEYHIKKYSFVLPVHTYSRTMTEWLDILHPKYTIIEYHTGGEGSRSLPNKYIFEFNEESDLLDLILVDQQVYHTCTVCDTHTKEFARVKKVWNNPDKQEETQADMCVSCYVGLLNRIGDDVDSFTAPTSELFAHRV